MEWLSGPKQKHATPLLSPGVKHVLEVLFAYARKPLGKKEFIISSLILVTVRKALSAVFYIFSDNAYSAGMDIGFYFLLTLSAAIYVVPYAMLLSRRIDAMGFDLHPGLGFLLLFLFPSRYLEVVLCNPFDAFWSYGLQVLVLLVFALLPDRAKAGCGSAREADGSYTAPPG